MARQACPRRAVAVAIVETRLGAWGSCPTSRPASWSSKPASREPSGSLPVLDFLGTFMGTHATELNLLHQGPLLLPLKSLD
jgi:hypothetical protein